MPNQQEFFLLRIESCSNSSWRSGDFLKSHLFPSSEIHFQATGMQNASWCYDLKQAKYIAEIFNKKYAGIAQAQVQRLSYSFTIP